MGEIDEISKEVSDFVSKYGDSEVSVSEVFTYFSKLYCPEYASRFHNWYLRHYGSQSIYLALLDHLNVKFYNESYLVEKGAK